MRGVRERLSAVEDQLYEHKMRADQCDRQLMQARSDMEAERASFAHEKQQLERSNALLSEKADNGRRAVADYRRRLAAATSDHAEQRLVLRRDVDSLVIQKAKVAQEGKVKAGELATSLASAQARLCESNEHAQKLATMLKDARSQISELTLKCGELVNERDDTRHRLAQSNRTAEEARKHYELKLEELEERRSRAVDERKVL